MANLSKNFTLGNVISQLRLMVRNLGSTSKIYRPDFVDMINRITLDIAQMLNAAQDPFYMQKQDVTASSFVASADHVYGATYANGTRIVTKTAHTLTSADVGKIILFFYYEDTVFDAPAGDFIAYSRIEEYLTANTFKIAHQLGSNITSNLIYAVLPYSTQEEVDISGLKIDSIIKLVDSLNGEITPALDSDFENIDELDDLSKSVHYNHTGHTLELKKGSDVTGLGTLTLYYYRTPNLAVNDSDYIDLKDSYIPTLINRCKAEIYELIGKTPPAYLAELTDNKVMKQREAHASREQNKALNAGSK